MLRPDGRLVAFYSGHGLGEMYYRISAAGPDVTRWGVQRRLVGSGLTTGARTRDGATYPSVVYHPTERRYYLVLRFGVRHEYYVTSSKDLVRWTVAAPLFRNAVHGLPDRPRPYAKVVAAATGTIHIAVTTSNPHPDTDSDLYAFTVRGGWLRTATGSPIRSFSTLRRVGPVSVRAGTKVRDDPGDASIRLWDLSLDRASRPVIAYIRRGRTYGVSRSTGRTWEHADVAPAPTGRYQGIAVAAGSPLSLYAVAAGTGLIERWTATSWPSGWVRRIMSREVSNRAPATPKSAPGRVVVAFMSGPYTTYDVFSSSIVASTAQPDGGTPLLPPPIAGARRSVPDELLPQVFPPFDG